MNELVSIIIPCYNCENTLKEAVFSIINQTYKNIEIIIVDDNSTDNSYNIALEIAKTDKRLKVIKNNINDNERYDYKIKRNINAGWSARNSGLNEAKGSFITFQDADDASLSNRIEIQVNLIEKYQASSIAVEWFKLDKKYYNKKLNFNKFINENTIKIINPQELYKLSQKNKGLFPKLFPKINKKIPFYIKRKRFINKLFFNHLDSYPGTGSSILLKKQIIEKIKFRHLKERVWPSFTGRGADRDFNFQVAEQFKNSYVINIPLYMWRVERHNNNYNHSEIEKYIY